MERVRAGSESNMRSEHCCGESIVVGLGSEGACVGHRSSTEPATKDAGAAESLGAPGRAALEPTAVRPAPRALVVASSGRLRRQARDRLATAGFEVLTTDDGLYALMIAHTAPPELIVVARVIAGLATPQFLSRLGSDERTRDVPVLTFEPDGVGVRLPARGRAAGRGEWNSTVDAAR